MTTRVFVPGPLVVGTEVTVTGDEEHYLVRVRRARAGAAVEVLDGLTATHDAVVVRTAPGPTVLRIGSARALPKVPPLSLWLGLPDPSAMAAALAGACELGATQVVLVRCERSPGGAPGDDRIARIVRAAMRQSGLPQPPSIDPPIALRDAVARADVGGVLAWEALREDTAWALPGGTPRRIVVGPEGGFTSAEATALIDAGFVPRSLGPWTLRCETAVVAGLSRLRAALAPSHGAVEPP